MATHVALLRGINVGGRHSLPMKRLVAFFEDAGCDNVRTYIQSGNVVFEAAAAAAKKVPDAVREAIRHELKFEAPVVVRSAKRWAEISAEHPFEDDARDEKLLHVGFLADKPGRAAVARLDPDRSPPDTFVVRGAEIWLHTPNGMARTKLTSQYLDSRLGTVTTVRNWRTVRKLAELARG